MERKLNELFDYNDGIKTIKLQVKEDVQIDNHGNVLLCIDYFFNKN